VKSATRLILWIGGLAAIAIALLHIALGPAAIPGSVPVNATMDSEDRFYATLFLGFGAALIWCARDLARRSGPAYALLAVFFAGGIARIISVPAVGWPDTLFIFLGGLELALPPIVGWMIWRHSTGSEDGANAGTASRTPSDIC
jgi:hypothetical protein